jgi:anaerobic ribonucleoside-triphosphate reductase
MSLSIYRLCCLLCGREWEEVGSDLELCFHGFTCPKCGKHDYKEVSRR